MDVDAELLALAADPLHPVDLAELALHLARDEYPDLDVPAYLARLDALADAVAPRLTGSLAERVATLAAFLFEEEGFRGNADDYYDARNSYLNDVLDRRAGLPITLSLVAAAVGERAGLAVHGVGLPGHFVAMGEEDGEAVLFDPFHGGQLLDPPAAEALVEAVTGQPFTLTADALRPAPPAAVAVRLLSNLKGVYLRGPDYERAARVTGRLVQLTPDDPLQRRDWGVTLVHAGHAGRAVDPLRFYLSRVPDADDREAVEGFLRRAQAEVARWN